MLHRQENEAIFFILTFHVVAKRHKHNGGSLMKKVQDFVVKGKQVFVGLEDSKRTCPSGIGISDRESLCSL